MLHDIEGVKMHYTAKYFKDALPEWKRKKDPPLSRVFYRRLSFYTAAFAANRNITANQVSYFSMCDAIVACVLFLFNKPLAILGAILVNVWLLLDCTDGNLARSVKSQPFGEFADSISSYVLVGLLCTTMGFYAFNHGGMLFQEGNKWIMLIGALSSSADTLMRLIYQKYKATERDLADKGIIEIAYDERKDLSKVNSLRVRIESDFGIGGILPLLVLLGAVFNAVDIVLLYTLAYYGGSCVVVSASQIRKAIKGEKAEMHSSAPDEADTAE